jgi:hypothetical protein
MGRLIFIGHPNVRDWIIIQERFSEDQWAVLVVIDKKQYHRGCEPSLEERQAKNKSSV